LGGRIYVSDLEIKCLSPLRRFSSTKNFEKIMGTLRRLSSTKKFLEFIRPTFGARLCLQTGEMSIFERL